MNINFNDKVAVITGGSTGIGAATAIQYAESGGKVVIGDINELDGKETAKLIQRKGGEALFHKTDVTIEDDVNNLMKTAEDTFGRIDTLVTSAGVLEGASVRIEDFEENTFDKVIDVNLKGTFFAIKYAAPIMGKTEGGVILCIASGAGIHGGSSSIAYASSKGGVNGLVMTAANHVGSHNIRIHTICPGGLATPLKLGQIAQSAKRDGNDPDQAIEKALKSLADPAGVARVLAFLASEEGSYVRGLVSTR